MEIFIALFTTLITLFVLLLKIVIGGFFYFLPAIIGARRRHASQKPLFWSNLLLGWTGFGWLALTLWACLGKKRY